MVIWRDAAGHKVKNEGRYKTDGTDLVITGANWEGMGRYDIYIYNIFVLLPFSFRFNCTAQNGFGVDMISSFLYPLAPAFF